MQIEWDDEKSASNFTKHGVDFLLGALIFEGDTFEYTDERRDYGEERIIAIGMVDGQFYTVVYTLREDVIRLISARKGGRRDRRKYEDAIARRNQGT